MTFVKLSERICCKRIIFAILYDLKVQFNNLYHIIIITKTRIFWKTKRKTLEIILSKIISMHEDNCLNESIKIKTIEIRHHSIIKLWNSFNQFIFKLLKKFELDAFLNVTIFGQYLFQTCLFKLLFCFYSCLQAWINYSFRFIQRYWFICIFWLFRIKTCKLV
jgi:hypothetical protein